MIEIARHYKNGPVKRKDISKNQGISAQYLENILITLKTSKLIQTVRGANGGFTLSRKPSEISMFEIVSALEGSVAPVQCIDSQESCERSVSCAARSFWQELNNVLVKTLSGTNLQDLLDKENALQGFDYSI